MAFRLLRCDADGFPLVFAEVRRSAEELALHLCDVLHNNLSSSQPKMLLSSNCSCLSLKMSRWKGVSVRGVLPSPLPGFMDLARQQVLHAGNSYRCKKTSSDHTLTLSLMFTMDPVLSRSQPRAHLAKKYHQRHIYHCISHLI